jgi:DNA helicase-2/ATP-dependent DNA helicase PcrA
MDDHIRLFYVSITRAKHSLYLLSHERTETGRETSRLPFLPNEFSILSKVKKEVPLTPLAQLYYPPFVKDEKALLLPLLEDYRMSVTHLNNFLNVANGGPLLFLEQNLLRFPQGKTTSNAFGSAMHRAIELLYRALRKEGKLPTIANLLTWFDQALKDERLSKSDFALERERGRKALSGFYRKKKSSFHKDDLVEVNFAHDGVFEGDVPLGGKIDKMVKVSSGEIRVHDFKTGKVYREWKGKSDYEKTRLHEYARQLTFYKILVEGSSRFAKSEVNTGVLEFLEPYKNSFVELSLEIKPEDVKRTATLIRAVYQKIMSLDFPDVSSYPQNFKGIISFEDDLINQFLKKKKD